MSGPFHAERDWNGAHWSGAKISAGDMRGAAGMDRMIGRGTQASKSHEWLRKNVIPT
ncbi:hypothetical protein [Brevundimonas sp.]